MVETSQLNVSESKSEWTSLEKAKLVASCATPLLIFIFGLIVAANIRDDENHRRADEIEAAQMRDDRAAQQAAARLQADRQATLLREAAQREEARKDAREASLIAFQREQILIDRSAAREEAQRARQRREAQTDKILDKRREIWTTAGPLLANARWRLYDIESGRLGTSAEIINSLIEESHVDLIRANDEIMPYESDFSPQFIESYYRFFDSAELMRINVGSSRLKAGVWDKMSRDVEQTYKALMVLARGDLARIEGGDAERAWAYATAPTSLDDR
ncbi:MAG TPA: hypothetical protein VGB59_06915 [Allosphingosinicella sp.]|jgi:hypothetical protein